MSYVFGFPSSHPLPPSFVLNRLFSSVPLFLSLYIFELFSQCLLHITINILIYNCIDWIDTKDFTTIQNFCSM